MQVMKSHTVFNSGKIFSLTILKFPERHHSLQDECWKD